MELIFDEKALKAYKAYKAYYKQAIDEATEDTRMCVLRNSPLHFRWINRFVRVAMSKNAPICSIL